MCERELESEQNCNILILTLLGITAFLYRSPGLLNRGPGAQLLCVLVFSTASYLQLVWSPNSLNFLRTELYNSSTPTQYLPITAHRNMHFSRLRNGMLDRHRAEITVMQFTGHSFPVHQLVTVLWDFNPVPYCLPSSPTPTEYRTSVVFGMACLDVSEVNILQKQWQLKNKQNKNNN